MLFNLGMTANAAAAHNNSEGASSQTETQLSVPARHSAPRSFSFNNLPCLGLGQIYNKNNTGLEAAMASLEQRRSMPLSAVGRLYSSDDDADASSRAAPSSTRSQLDQQKPKKQAARPKTIYQIAHPATNVRHKRLKLRPKLLLQLQRVPSTSRPIPVFDVLPSTLFMPRLARNFPTILRGKKCLGPNDLIVTTSDQYERTVGDATDKGLSSDDESADQHEIVATICQLCRDDALSKGKVEICFEYGPVWEATPLANGSYEFAAYTDSGILIVRWVRRGQKKRRVSAPPDTLLQEETRRFTFSVIDPSTRRHPVIASMTRNRLEVYDRYSPAASTAPSSPTMSVVSDASELDAPLDQQVIETDENLRKLIIITSIWVAFREGWSHNFRYNDATINSRAVRSPNTSKNNPSPIAGTDTTDRDAFGKEIEADRQTPIDPARRGATWSALPSQQSGSSARSIQYGSLSKRSNSTGAAFIERSNRRSSTGNVRPNRHSMFSSPRQSYEEGSESKSPVRNSGSHRSWSQSRKKDAEDMKGELLPSDVTAQSQDILHYSQDQPQQASPKPVNSQREQPGRTKSKRRHRFSNLFDCFARKGYSSS